MTDKEIIINGIDVSECAYLKPLDNGVYECIAGTQQCLKYRVCECNHNCNYKQLKRKEQECEKLKKRLESFQKDYSKLYQVVENKGYIKELDQLKQILAEIKEIAEEEVHTRMLFADKKSFGDFNKILQKISECEVEICQTK